MDNLKELLSQNKSKLSPERARVCEPLAQEVKDVVLKFVEDGKISLREAADMAEGLAFAFKTVVELVDEAGLPEMLDAVVKTSGSTRSGW